MIKTTGIFLLAVGYKSVPFIFPVFVSIVIGSSLPAEKRDRCRKMNSESVNICLIIIWFGR
jgi:hypothetical protein